MNPTVSSFSICFCSSANSGGVIKYSLSEVSTPTSTRYHDLYLDVEVRFLGDYLALFHSTLLVPIVFLWEQTPLSLRFQPHECPWTQVHCVQDSALVGVLISFLAKNMTITLCSIRIPSWVQHRNHPSWQSQSLLGSQLESSTPCYSKDK